MHAEVEHYRIEKQQTLYHQYALAAEDYSKIPNYTNWDRKEKALETYNAFIQNCRKQS
jgi:hypothetical protein